MTKLKKKLLSLIMFLLALLVFILLFPDDVGKSKGDCMKSCISITPSVLRNKNLVFRKESDER